MHVTDSLRRVKVDDGCQCRLLSAWTATHRRRGSRPVNTSLPDACACGDALTHVTHSTIRHAGVRMEDSLAALGNVHDDDMPDSRYLRPRRLTFEQAGGEQDFILFAQRQLAVLMDEPALRRTQPELGCHTIVRAEPGAVLCSVSPGHWLPCPW